MKTKSKNRLWLWLSLGAALVLVGIAAALIFFGKLPCIFTGSDWPTPNHDYENTRTAKNATISSKNISKMGVEWTFPIKGVSEWGAATTNPIILGNTVYFQDLKSNIYAVDFKTGKPIWEKDYDLDIAGPSGVTIDDDQLFAVKGHFEIVALDLKGNELWTKKLSESENVGIDIQPLAKDGIVYVSTVPGTGNQNFYQGGAYGVLYALDAATGAEVWNFNTVATADIWGNPKVNSGGGAWFPPAIENGIIYWGMGNPAPWPGTTEFPNGSSRPGPNLYTNAMLALDAKTGKLLWYNQVLPHDLFDYDLQVSPILATVTIGGMPQDVVLGGGKMGKVYAFNKATGQKIWETKVGTHLNDELTVLPAGTTSVSPGPLGGVETNMAYSDGIVYVPVVNMTVQYTPSAFVTTSFDIAAGTGELVALDAATGKILWTIKQDSINVGGATVVNDLVFTSTLNGKIYAYAKKTGEKVWEYQAAGGINGWPAVKGDTIIFPVGMGATPALVAFTVGGAGVAPAGTTFSPGGAGKAFTQ